MMNSGQLLQTDILDIIFEERNKTYGAYELRKNYPKRIAIAIAVMGIFVSTIILIRSIRGSEQNESSRRIINVGETTFTGFKEKKEPQIKVKLPEIRKAATVASVQFTNIKIAKDKEVIAIPPDVRQLENAKIDLKTQAGDIDVGIVAPPDAPVGTNVIAGPDEKRDRSDVVVIDVDIQASFPGGVAAWMKYVQKEIEKNLNDFSDEDFGTCLVKFIVDKEGKVSDVQATTMKGTKLAEVAVNAIRKGPRWIPAQQNGHYVNAYRVQPVTLKRPE